MSNNNDPNEDYNSLLKRSYDFENFQDNLENLENNYNQEFDQMFIGNNNYQNYDIDDDFEGKDFDINNLNIYSQNKIILNEEELKKIKYSHLDHETAFKFGLQYMEDGLIKNSQECFLVAINKSPKVEQYYHFLGKSFQDGDDDLGAINAFRKAIELNPKTNSRLDLSVSYYNENQDEKAIDELIFWVEQHSCFPPMIKDTYSQFSGQEKLERYFSFMSDIPAEYKDMHFHIFSALYNLFL
eukprot:TRINITY_DN5661_c0_g1_i1.p1 TRINITY_DN5661_c0_g1~~TRINITY_DN5661_c0_g1_i1.p1  ORF type:complete len:241 (-),score=59.61 TRINITY_DN5661_c0_g1_i1:533-1255(-)